MGLTDPTSRWSTRSNEFHERAASQVGCSDFGDLAYSEGLEALLTALDAEPPAVGAKAAAAEALILGPLVARLHTQAQFKANPGFRTRELLRPLIVIGVPRTGTTALHNLLSQDPQFQGIEKWLCGAPMVRPSPPTWDLHPQYQACVATTERMFALAPEAMKAHGVLAHEVDECLLPMAQSFCSNWFPSQLDLPGYDRWLKAADERPSYARYKDVLRLVGLHDDRRWLLKNPSHVFGIDALLQTFPDAIIVQTHRSPVASLASLVSLLGNIVKAYTGEDIDRERRLQRETEFWAEAVQRSMAAQDRAPDRFVNVFQRDVRRDPVGVVRTIYERAGLELSDRAEQAMRAWAVANAEQPGVGHSYANLADEGPIREAFAAYIERYGF